MKDIYMVTNTELPDPQNPDGYWRTDVQLHNGDFVRVPRVENNIQQRALIAAVTERGTIPGAQTQGIDWAAYLTGNKVAMQIQNDIQVRIGQICGTSMTNKIVPVFSIDDGKIKLVLVGV